MTGGPLILKLETRNTVVVKERLSTVAAKEVVSMIEKDEANTNRNTMKGFAIKAVNAA